MLRYLEDVPFAQVVIGVCVALYVASLMLSRGRIGMGGMMDFLAPSPDAVVALGATGAYPILGLHRWWTPLSASFLHGSALHILFNMLWVRDLVPTVAHLYGSSRAIIIFTVSGVLGFLTSSLIGFVIPFFGSAGVTLGASAAVFGLLGAVIYYQRRAPTRLIGFSAGGLAIVMLVFGFVMPGVDNFAHLGGLAGGFLASMWMDPLKREGQGHVVFAVVCLLASAAAIVASLVTAFV